MAILDQYGNPVYSGKRFLDASTNTGNHPAWPLRHESIRKSINFYDLQTAVSVSRRMYANNGIFRGAIAQKGMFSIGRAWRPIFQGSNKSWGDKAAKWLFEEWMPICDVRGGVSDFQTNLYLDSVAVDRDGDFGILLTETEDGYPQLQRIAQHRIKSPTTLHTVEDGPYKDLKIHQGVIYNSIGRPVAYRVYEDPVNEWDKVDFSFVDVPAESFIHVYEPEWYEQGRGLPAFTHALNLFRSMAQSQEWEELTMLISSAISLVEDNESGGVDPNDPSNLVVPQQGGDGLQYLNLEGGLIRYFKSGSGAGLKQFVNHKPGQEWDIFNDRLVRVALVDVWPFGLIWKPEGGGTDTRADIQKARVLVEDRQGLLMPPARRQISYAISKAMQRGILPFNDEWYKWGFSIPPKLGIDDGRDGKERRENIKAGIITEEQDQSDRGGNWITNRDQKEREADDKLTRAARLMKKHNVPLETALALLGQSNPNQKVAGKEDAQPESEAE